MPGTPKIHHQMCNSEASHIILFTKYKTQSQVVFCCFLGSRGAVESIQNQKQELSPFTESLLWTYVSITTYLTPSLFGLYGCILIEGGVLRFPAKARWFSQTPLASRPEKRKGTQCSQQKQYQPIKPISRDWPEKNAKQEKTQWLRNEKRKHSKRPFGV